MTCTNVWPDYSLIAIFRISGTHAEWLYMTSVGVLHDVRDTGGPGNVIDVIHPSIFCLGSIVRRVVLYPRVVDYFLIAIFRIPGTHAEWLYMTSVGVPHDVRDTGGPGNVVNVIHPSSFCLLSSRHADICNPL